MKKNFPLGMLICALLPCMLLYSCKDNASNKVAGASFQQAIPVSNPSEPAPAGSFVNFVPAARKVTPGVVHIKTTYTNRSSGYPFGMFDDRGVPAAASGSGVTISADGYIATNNHVVENAERIEVVYPDRRSFSAKLVGRDPDTDLALLKVDGTNLPHLAFGNSDNAQVGEWVLAVGYPYTLNTTVTAGVISAKGRSIGIINNSRGYSGGAQANTAIESFIQTDAAINPGNSGGALVNANGDLIGINTAIASLTGSYAGYAFAIPANLAKKVLEDLRNYGSVRRGLLGVSFPSPVVEDQYLRQQGIDPATVKGVLITDVQEGSAADAGGLKEGDIIQQIDAVPLYSSAEFSERIARHRPGDKVQIAYLRNGKLHNTTVTLKGEEPRQARAGRQQSLNEIYDKLGAKFSPLTSRIKERYDINSGVVVAEVREGGFFDLIGIPPGTIITRINGKAVNSPEDVDAALLTSRSGLQILGIAPDGTSIAFNIPLGT